MTADNMLNMVDATATRSTTIAACPAERVGRTTVNSLPTLLALNRTVGIVLISILFFGLGEQLWSPFLPAYLGAKTSAAGMVGRRRQLCCAPRRWHVRMLAQHVRSCLLCRRWAAHSASG